MTGSSLVQRTWTSSSTSGVSIGLRSGRFSPTEPENSFQDDHMLSNPFPKSKRTTTGNIDITPSSNSSTKVSSIKLLNRSNNRIPSNSSTCETSTITSRNPTSSTTSSSSFGQFTRLQYPRSTANQPSAIDSSSSAYHYNNGSMAISTRSKDKEDDSDFKRTNGNLNNALELPRLGAGTQTGFTHSGTSPPVASVHQQRLEIAGISRISGETIISSKSAVHADTPTKLLHPRGLVGLQNLGNTWYVQSQNLDIAPNGYIFSQPPLSGLYMKEINDSSPTKGALATVFGELITTLWSSAEFTSMRPVELKRVIGKVASRFTGYDQQDAQEFLRFLLDGLHEDLNKIKKKPPYYEIKDHGDTVKDRDVSDEYWKFYRDRNRSALSELFCGQLRSEIRCMTCNHRSLCFDVFWDLSLPVPKKNKSSSTHMRLTSYFSGSSSSSSSLARSSSDRDDKNESLSSSATPKGVSVHDCLKAYTEQEFLNENDAFYCSNCKTHRAVAKKISIYRLPEVLVLHLKRFSYSTFSRDKVTTAINFPAQSLDIAEYCAADAVLDGSTLYDLTGVVNHVGSLNGGHYTAECLNADTKEWYDFNDSSVSLVKKPQLSNPSAYILFYQRREEKSLTI